ncbi:hypothetical protein ACOBQB_00230 [Streptomyces sp. G5(2025)]|uniref:hypothetical protein n=1 Tax=Streptomyces sp. G5(2025) TaxID=3406628 RepID=UPI003C2A02E7
MNTNHPTTAKRPSVLWPLVAAAVCILLGVALLSPGADPDAPRRGSAGPANQTPSRMDYTAPQRAPRFDPAGRRKLPLPSAPSASQAAHEMPVPGEGPAGDHAVQALLDRSSPRDPPRTREKQLVALASRIWRADITGAERTRWPKYFNGAPLRAAYRNVRIQAGIARTADGRTDRVRVRLIWAGISPAGQKQDGRLAQILLDRHGTSWMPVR